MRAGGCTGEVGKVFPVDHRFAVTALWDGEGCGVPFPCMKVVKLTKKFPDLLPYCQLLLSMVCLVAIVLYLYIYTAYNWCIFIWTPLKGLVNEV